MSRPPVETLTEAIVRPLRRLGLLVLAAAIVMALAPALPSEAAAPLGTRAVVLAAAEEGAAEETGEEEAAAEEEGGGSGLMMVSMIAAAALVLGAFKMIGSSES